jgi:hypothetical protein
LRAMVRMVGAESCFPDLLFTAFNSMGRP